MLLCLLRFSSALSACSLKWAGNVSIQSFLAGYQNMVKAAFIFDTLLQRRRAAVIGFSHQKVLIVGFLLHRSQWHLIRQMVFFIFISALVYIQKITYTIEILFWKKYTYKCFFFLFCSHFLRPWNGSCNAVNFRGTDLCYIVLEIL